MYSHHILLTIPYITKHKLFLDALTTWQQTPQIENNWYSNLSDCSKNHLCADCKTINWVTCFDASYLSIELSRGYQAMRYKHDVQLFPNNLVNVEWMRVWDQHHTCDLCFYCRVKVAVRCRPFNQRWELKVFDNDEMLMRMFSRDILCTFEQQSNVEPLINLSLRNIQCLSFQRNIIDMLSLG